MTATLTLWTLNWGGFVALLFWLAVGHIAGDFALQSDFMAQAKNRHTRLGRLYWKHVLPAHAGIHAAFVALITGSVALGLIELVLHAATDYLKCDGKLSLNQDQAVHYACKLAYALIVVAAPAGWLPGLWVTLPGLMLLFIVAVLITQVPGPARVEGFKP